MSELFGVEARRYNPDTVRTESVEDCYACRHKVWAEWDEDGSPVIYRAIEPDEEAVLLKRLRLP